jgi:type IV pilus assembly protein PilV
MQLVCLRERKFERERAQRGFSLLEVMITIVVVAIGLLGVAGMQVSSIKLAELSQTRATGVLLANDILDRIRSNPEPGDVLAYSTPFGAAPSAVGTLPERDLRAWKLAMADPLRGMPGGDGSIAIDQAGTGCTAGCSIVTITVRWDEARQRGGSATQTFTIRTRV